MRDHLMKLVPLEARALEKTGAGRVEMHWRPVGRNVELDDHRQPVLAFVERREIG